MKKAILLITALLAVCAMGLAGCNKSDSANGGSTDELQPRSIITEDTEGDGTENDGMENEQKPPRCDDRMPHKPRRGDHDRPLPRPMPKPERGEKR